MSHRASATPFQVGPPSPSSPAAGLQKENRPVFVPSDQIPQTPTSPLMSVSTQNYASNFTSSQPSPNQAPPQSANFSSPPSSAPMSTQVSQQPTVSTAHSFPTPASSVSGQFVASTSAEDSENMDKSSGTMNQEPGATSAQAPSTHPVELEHRRTDHDRHLGGSDADLKEPGQSVDVDMDTSVPALNDPAGDRQGEDFTSAFHLCKRCKSSQRSILCGCFRVPRFVNTVP